MDYFPHCSNPTSSDHSCNLVLPTNVGVEKRKKDKSKKNKDAKVVRLSTDPQSVAARERRHRISDRFKILQSLVPGGAKLDTVSMLEEAIHYVKFLKAQIWLHQSMMKINGEDHLGIVEDGPPSFVDDLEENYFWASQNVQESSPPQLDHLPYDCFGGEGGEGTTMAFDGHP